MTNMDNSDIELDLFAEALRQALPGLPLTFNRNMPFGTGVHVFFPNGYGVSVQDIDSQRQLAEAALPGLTGLGAPLRSNWLELAALVGCALDWSVTSRLALTNNDVLPGLDAAEAAVVATQIARLHPNAHTLTCRYCGRSR